MVSVTLRRLKRLEHLMERRPELLSSVMLRQNPHNVHEWHKRVHLFPENPTRQILVYTEAVKTVDSDKARTSAMTSPVGASLVARQGFCLPVPAHCTGVSRGWTAHSCPCIEVLAMCAVGFRICRFSAPGLTTASVH